MFCYDSNSLRVSWLFLACFSYWEFLTINCRHFCRRSPSCFRRKMYVFANSFSWSIDGKMSALSRMSGYATISSTVTSFWWPCIVVSVTFSPGSYFFLNDGRLRGFCMLSASLESLMFRESLISWFPLVFLLSKSFYLGLIWSLNSTYFSRVFIYLDSDLLMLSLLPIWRCFSSSRASFWLKESRTSGGWMWPFGFTIMGNVWANFTKLSSLFEEICISLNFTPPP